jgi:hypothetical protein
MLVDHAYAGTDGIRRRMKGLLFAIDGDAAFIRLVKAIKLAHQGALPGAILTEQRVDFSGTNIEANLGIRQHSWEALDDIAHLNMLDAPGLVCRA